MSIMPVADTTPTWPQRQPDPFRCAECHRLTVLVGRAPDGRLVCPVCVEQLGRRPPLPGTGPTETKDTDLDPADFQGGHH